MTLMDAIKKTECIEVDYSNMDEVEIAEFDEALDMVFKAARDMAKLKGDKK